MFASYGYPRHSFGAGRCGGGFGFFSPTSRYDEEAYAYEQYRRRQAELAHLERARQIRAAREEAYLREVARRQQEQEASSYPRLVSLAATDEVSQFAIRKERARRQDPLVEVVFSDGSHRLAPLSWVRQQRERSPSPPHAHDTALQTPAPVHGPHDVVIEPRPRDPLTLDEAATMVQRFLRRHLHLRQVAHVRDTFSALRQSFAATPAARDPSTLVFLADAETPKLAFNTPANKDVQLYEEELVRLLTKLDGIESHGDDGVKKARKGLAVEIEEALSGLDQLKAFGWDAQRHSEVAQPQPDEATVEPAVEQVHPEPADLIDTDMEDGADATDHASLKAPVEASPEATPVEAPAEASVEAPGQVAETKETESVASSTFPRLARLLALRL